jgi:hypothetical protein
LKRDHHIRRWRRLWEEQRLAVIATAVLAWLVLISAVHVGLNHRRYAVGATPAAAVEVGGLPVT